MTDDYSDEFAEYAMIGNVIDLFRKLPEEDVVRALTRLKEMYPYAFSSVWQEPPPASSVRHVFPSKPEGVQDDFWNASGVNKVLMEIFDAFYGFDEGTVREAFRGLREVFTDPFTAAGKRNAEAGPMRSRRGGPKLTDIA